MANQIQIPTNATSSANYAIIRDGSGLVWDTTTETFVPYVTGDLNNYIIDLAEQGTASQHYGVDIPSAIGAGLYYVSIFTKGGSYLEGDVLIGAGDLAWDGSAIIDPSSLTIGSLSASALLQVHEQAACGYTAPPTRRRLQEGGNEVMER